MNEALQTDYMLSQLSAQLWLTFLVFTILAARAPSVILALHFVSVIVEIPRISCAQPLSKMMEILQTCVDLQYAGIRQHNPPKPGEERAFTMIHLAMLNIPPFLFTYRSTVRVVCSFWGHLNSNFMVNIKSV